MSTSGIVFRQLTGSDVQQMHVIETLCFALPWSMDSLLQEMNDNPFAWYLGAFDGKTLAGYVGIWKIMDEAHMTNLAVHPQYQRRGIARELLKHVKRYALKTGADSMTLEVRESNIAAQNLYTSMGFTAVGKRRRYYSDNNEDALIMWCRDLHCHDKG